jgi:predicted nucleic acid-binding protein
MDGPMSTQPEYFLDTAFAIALASKSDVFHQDAIELAKSLKTTRARLVTTRAVLLEIGNALSKQRYREGAATLLGALEADPQVHIIALTNQLYHQAVGLFRARPDKEWGLTDCMSFVVMQQMNITDALTTDDHFRQAGFRVLLA